MEELRISTDIETLNNTKPISPTQDQNSNNLNLSNVINWTKKQVGNWLVLQKLGKYEKLFYGNHINS
jgi:hypothetical protein